MATERAQMSPPHYTLLSLKNFRGFGTRSKIQLAPLTFLVGPNSSGKSSICDALLLLAQSGLPSLYGNFRPIWSDELVDLGSFRDAVHNHDTGKTISIDFEVGNMPLDAYSWRKSKLPNVGISIQIAATNDDLVGFVTQIGLVDRTSTQKLTLRRPKSASATINARISSDNRSASLKIRDDVDSKLRVVSSLTAKINRNIPARAKRWDKLLRGVLAQTWGLHFFIDGTVRVSSARGAPQRWYARNRAPVEDSKLYQTVDPIFLEQRNRERSIARRKRPKTPRDLQALLKELDIADRISPGELGPYHSAINLRDNITGIESSLIDVGYGASQVIPVIAACLSSDQDVRSAPLIIEQPEIHLHPRAQGTIAELLARTSHDRQVIVETHSEHMINKARILIAQGELDPKSVIINYVNRDRTGSHVTAIPLTASGDFGVEWPKGFFDERYQDTLELMKLKSSEKKV